jgi:leader peptidase (prepilin peptidase) / N-methyltransferase
MSLACALGMCAVAASLIVARGWLGAAGSALAILAVAIAIIDRRTFIIPDPLNLSACLVGLVAAALAAPGEPHVAILHAVLRATVMFLALFGFRAGYRRLRRREGIGLGDVKLAGVAGVWLDWVDLPIAVDIAALAALATVLIRRLRGESLDMRARLPFGAFLAPAIWLCWLLAAWRGDKALAQSLAALSSAY